MRLNEDGKTVAAMDLLCPGHAPAAYRCVLGQGLRMVEGPAKPCAGIGELVGGSQREERIEVLDERIEGSAS